MDESDDDCNAGDEDAMDVDDAVDKANGDSVSAEYDPFIADKGFSSNGDFSISGEFDWETNEEGATDEFKASERLDIDEAGECSSFERGIEEGDSILIGAGDKDVD